MSIDDLIEKYKNLTNKQDLTRSVIVFDEIQYLNEWSVQIKIQVDHNKKTKIIAAGSAAGALRRQSKESRAGRFSHFMLPPMTFVNT